MPRPRRARANWRPCRPAGAAASLAATLIIRPAALLLDEPTNHLDDGAVSFLSETLRGWEGHVLLASHDRAFIDDTATCVLDLDTAPWQALLTVSGGGRVPGIHRCAGAYTDIWRTRPALAPLLVTDLNGCGKTTLLHWIATGAPPTTDSSGALAASGRIAVVPQQLPRPGDPGLGEETWEAGIGEVGAGVLHPVYWGRPVAELSAGNQRRVQLAAAVAADPEILIIDEPTNYLDLDTTEALEAALAAWNGTLLVASHDRWLVAHWSGPRLRLTSGLQDHRPMT